LAEALDDQIFRHKLSTTHIFLNHMAKLFGECDAVMLMGGDGDLLRIA
jgi:hypothetical protein